MNLGSVGANSDILLYIYNDTYNVSSNEFFSCVLNSSSPYYMSGNGSFHYLIDLRSIPYFNNVTGNKYRFTLVSHDTNNNYTTTSYNVTLSWSSTVQSSIDENNSQDMTSFFTSNNVDSSFILDSMPSNPTINYDGYQYIDTLFNVIKDAFVDDEPIDFVFTFPQSNETVTFTSDYIENKLPSVIVGLIRLFYWYFLARFILKDIMKNVDALRSARYWSTDDANIKTEVL